MNQNLDKIIEIETCLGLNQKSDFDHMSWCHWSINLSDRHAWCKKNRMNKKREEEKFDSIIFSFCTRFPLIWSAFLIGRIS